MANPERSQSPLPSLDEIPRPVVGMRTGFADQTRLPSHRHAKAQLVHASSGVMTVTTDVGTWVVPPQRAVWVPEATDHAIRMSGQVTMRTIYLEPGVARQMPNHCCVVTVTPLLRELVWRASSMEPLYPLGGREERLMEVLVDELQAAQTTPLHLPTPSDPRLRRVTNALLADPADKRGLAAWARTAGASPRTLDRLFRRHTGMTFGAWRQQLRLLRALEQLASGEAVTSVALSLGYDSLSAFITMFRRNLGETPGRYFEAV